MNCLLLSCWVWFLLTLSCSFGGSLSPSDPITPKTDRSSVTQTPEFLQKAYAGLAGNGVDALHSASDGKDWEVLGHGSPDVGDVVGGGRAGYEEGRGRPPTSGLRPLALHSADQWTGRVRPECLEVGGFDIVHALRTLPCSYRLRIPRHFSDYWAVVFATLPSELSKDHHEYLTRFSAEEQTDGIGRRRSSVEVQVV